MMPEQSTTPSVAWVDGAFVDWNDARVHVDTHGVLGGLNAYEVVAGFWVEAEGEIYLLRAAEHLDRLWQTARLMRIPELSINRDEVLRLACELVARNEYRGDVLIRIVHYLGTGPLFSYRADDVSTGLFLLAKPAILDPPYERGIHIETSNWLRLPDMSAPPRVKCGANYQNVRLAQIQAQVDGYDDAVLLNSLGKVCELPLANIFLVRGDTLITPSITSGILEGITRDTIISLAHELGIAHEVREVDRSELYVATEAFATGTGREVWPIVSIDRFVVGGGQIGSLTRQLQRRLHLVMRNLGGHTEWLTPVYGSGTTGHHTRVRLTKS
jgi:branched-chain amino acid aminotransferase